jgi:uncharacterized protein (DUF2147 family)
MVLKNRILLLGVLIFICYRAHAQVRPGAQINGTWLDEAKDGKIAIFQTGNTWSGKLLSGKYVYDEKGKPNHDIHNPDASLRDRPLLGMIILTGLVYENGKWQDGMIYDPISGKYYNVIITVKGDKLDLRGYIGVLMLGKTTTWQRVVE